MIAHGFLRRGEFMSGWADEIARAGMTAVTVDLCASSTPNGRHADNGADSSRCVARSASKSRDLRRRLGGRSRGADRGVARSGRDARPAAARSDECRRPSARAPRARARTGRSARRQAAALQRVAQHRSSARRRFPTRRSCASTTRRIAISNGRPTRSAASRASRSAAANGIVVPKDAHPRRRAFRSSTRSRRRTRRRCRGGRATSAKPREARPEHWPSASKLVDPVSPRHGRFACSISFRVSPRASLARRARRLRLAAGSAVGAGQEARERRTVRADAVGDRRRDPEARRRRPERFRRRPRLGRWTAGVDGGDALQGARRLRRGHRGAAGGRRERSRAQGRRGGPRASSTCAICSRRRSPKRPS